MLGVKFQNSGHGDLEIHMHCHSSVNIPLGSLLAKWVTGAACDKQVHILIVIGAASRLRSASALAKLAHAIVALVFCRSKHMHDFLVIIELDHLSVVLTFLRHRKQYIVNAQGL